MTAKRLSYAALVLLVGLSVLPLAGCGGQTTIAGGNGVQTVAQAPTTTAIPAGSQFTSAQSVVLQTSAGATIYYTTDGSTPSTSSPRYSGAIAIASATDLKFFAVDGKGNQEGVKTEHYSFVTPFSLRLSAVGVSQALSGLKVTLTLPAGVSVATSAGAVPAGVIAASGVALGSAAVLPDSVSYDANAGQLSFILYSTLPAGFGAGEFASVTCRVSGALPAPGGFSAILEPVDLSGNALAPAGASFQLLP